MEKKTGSHHPKVVSIFLDAIPHESKELWYIDGLGHCEADSVIEDE